MVQVQDVMSPEIPSISPQATLREAAERMSMLNVSTLFVIEGGRLAGVIGLRDLFTVPIPAHYPGAALRQRDLVQFRQTWENSPVKHLMNENLLTVTEETPVLKAAEIMINSGKHPLPVVRAGQVVGVVTRMAIVRAILESQTV